MHLFLLCLILFAGGWTLLAVASQEFKGHNIVQIVLGIICGIGYGALCIYTLKFRAAETSAIADYQFWFCLAFLMAFTFIDIIWLIRGRKMSCGNFFVWSMIAFIVAFLIMVVAIIIAMHICK